MDPRDQLLQHLEHADLDGVDELEDGDVITGAVVLLRVERLSEEGTAVVMTSDVDFFSQLGLLTAARDLMRDDGE
ncbi:hypothetical protein [Brachybacterium massiliense]|uniref:hypothetical protein n=1 Tax=Brachybacterium massiliense TaxID=1755098 RepID=UPI000B3BAEC4|nr:hypothetical protein [Brachybacterium massiliense]